MWGVAAVKRMVKRLKGMDGSSFPALCTWQFTTLCLAMPMGGQFLSWGLGFREGIGIFALTIVWTAIGYTCLCLCTSETFGNMTGLALTRCAVGFHVGFCVGHLEVLKCTVLMAISVLAFGKTFSTFIPQLAPYEACIWCAFFLVNFPFSSDGGHIWKCVCVMVASCLLLVLIFIFGSIHRVHFDSNGAHESQGVVGFLEVFPLGSRFFLGLEMVAFCFDIPNRCEAIPRAQFSSLIVLFCSSILLLFIAGSLPEGLPDSTFPLTSGFGSIFGIPDNSAAMISSIAACTSAVGFMLCHGSLLNSLAESDLAPAIFKFNGSKGKRTVTAYITACLISFGLCLAMKNVRDLSGKMFNVAVLVSYIVNTSQCITCGVLRVRLGPRQEIWAKGAFRSPLGLFGVAFAMLVWVVGVISVAGFQNDEGFAVIVVASSCIVLSVIYVVFVKRMQSFSGCEQRMMFVLAQQRSGDAEKNQHPELNDAIGNAATSQRLPTPSIRSLHRELRIHIESDTPQSTADTVGEYTLAKGAGDVGGVDDLSRPNARIEEEEGEVKGDDCEGGAEGSALHIPRPGSGKGQIKAIVMAEAWTTERPSMPPCRGAEAGAGKRSLSFSGRVRLWDPTTTRSDDEVDDDEDDKGRDSADSQPALIAAALVPGPGPGPTAHPIALFHQPLAFEHYDVLSNIFCGEMQANDLIPTMLADWFCDVTHLCDGSGGNIFTAKRLGPGRGEREDRSTVVALKIIKPEESDDEVKIGEFIEEKRALQRARHTNIIKIFGFGHITWNGGLKKRIFLELEYLPHGMLSSVLCSARAAGSLPFSSQRLLRLARELLSALVYLHSEMLDPDALIHRDLKPDNLGFAADGSLRVIDFGLATIVHRGSCDEEGTYQLTGTTGSMRYMAPEVAKHQPYNEKVDIYSFGLLIYQCWTGQTPFAGMNRTMFMERVVGANERPRFPAAPLLKDLEVGVAVSELIVQCWDANWRARPSAGAALHMIVEIEQRERERERAEENAAAPSAVAGASPWVKLMRSPRRWLSL